MRCTFKFFIAAVILLLTGSAFAQNVEYVGSALWSDIRDAKVVGDYAYCVLTNGLEVLDVTDPASPSFVSKLYLHGNAMAIEVAGSYAYVAAGDSGIQIFNVTDPANPIFTGGYVTNGHINKIFVSGNYAYAASDTGNNWTGLLIIINISDPTNPIIVGCYHDLFIPLSIVVRGDFAYAADQFNGLKIIVIGNPSNPILAGSYYMQYGARAVSIEGNYSYVQGRYLGLQVINISDPANPYWAYSSDIWAADVFGRGNYAYLASGDAGLRILDISDPANPVDAGGYDTPGRAVDVFISGDYTYVADSSSLMILRFTPTGIGDSDNLPGDFTLSQNYPNPFNAQTTIQYSLPKAGGVSIDIFDILGRKIETLAEGIMPAGNHQAIWNASAQSSGIYFYRIKAGESVETKKMVLMK